MSKNFETVFLILECEWSIPIWLNENKITKEDIITAMGYIKEQNLLTSEELTEKMEYFKYAHSVYADLAKINSAGKLDKFRKVVDNILQEKNNER